MRTGSLQNYMADNSTPTLEPEVGMGCTLIRWTDRQAATIVDITPSGHQITVQHDAVERIDHLGMSDAQEYIYHRDTQGAREIYTRRKDGTYRQKGGDSRCIIGRRDHYHDYSF